MEKTNTTITAQLAKHFKAIHFGNNWSDACLQEHLSEITWQEATQKVANLNTIVALTYHINYFVEALRDVLEGKPLSAKDQYSYDHPPIQSERDWNTLVYKVFTDAEAVINLISQLPEEQLNAPFVDEKYGSYYENIHGIIEHCHYHLGQIVIIKKLINAPV